MWKNLLTLLISLCLCAAVFWWVAPLLTPGIDNTLPDYGQLVAYDPARPGGHLKPGTDQLVRGARHGEGVRWTTNSQGFRNRHEISPEPAPGVLRILFYGDSFVDGMRTDQDNTIGAVLERELELRLGQSVELVISGHNNPANAWYHWQTHGRHFHPHFVILGLTMGNDFISHNFGAGVLPVVESMEYLVATDPTVSMAGVSNAFVMIPQDGFVPEDQRSHRKKWVQNLNQALARRFFFLAHRAPPALDPRPGAPGQAMAAGFFVSLGLYYQGSIPFIQSVWRDFETLLPGFVAQVRYFGARPLLITFPTRVEALPGNWSRLIDDLQLEPARFDLQAPSRRIAALCERNTLPCLDTAAALQAGQNESEVFRPLGNMHLSDHGQAVTANAIAGFMENLMQTKPVPGPTADWLEKYRLQVHEWAMRALAEEAPWVDPQTGSAHLTRAQDRDALGTLLIHGWRSADSKEPFWGGEGVASIRIPVTREGMDYLIKLHAKPFLAEENNFQQRIIISIDGEKLGELVTDEDEFAHIPIVLSADRLTRPWTRVDLEFPDALVPAEIGQSTDLRRLGIALIGLEITPREP